MTEFVNTLAKKHTNKVFTESTDGKDEYLSSLSDDEWRQKFTTTENFDAAQKLLKFGDDKNMKKLSGAGLNTGKVNTTGSAPRPQIIHSVVGFCPNVPRFLMGAPACMNDVKRKIFKISKVINVFYNLSVSWKVKTTTIANTNAALVNALLALEMNGYRVNLYVGEYSKCKDEYFLCAVKIKDSATVLDKKKIAYPLVNPSFFRRHMFRALETSDVTEKGWSDNYGYPTGKEKANQVKAALKTKGINLDTYISFNDISYMSSQDILNTCFADHK